MSKRPLFPAHEEKLRWRIITKSRFLFPVLFLFFHQVSNAAVFTSIANGNWTSPSTWAGNVAPGSTIGAADVVNIGHVVTYTNSNDLEVFGTVNIINGTFQTALTGSGENKSVFVRPGGDWNMCNSRMYLPIFNCGYDCFTGGNKSGNFSNNGGSILIYNSTVQIAQNWEDVSNPGAGTRTFDGGCLIVGENFTNKGSEDLYDGICVEMGWHGSANMKNEYRMKFQNATIIRLIGSGSLENVASGPNGVTGGPGTPDIAALYISNGNVVNSATWTASILNFCINGGSVSGSNAAQFNAQITNNDTPAACAAAMMPCTNCPLGACALVANATVVNEVSCNGNDGSVTAEVVPGTSTDVCATGATTFMWNTMPPQNTQIAINLPPGTYIVTVTDASGCSDTASVTLLPPTNCCELIVTCAPENGGIFGCISGVPAPNPDLITVVDSCGPYTITVVEDSTGLGCVGDTMFITYEYIIDDGVDMDTCIQIFRVIDEQVPVITCPAGVTVSCEADVPTCPVDFAAFDALPGASATDNCDLSLSYSCTTGPLIGGGCGGTITRTHTVTDNCGNTATCTQVFTIDDNTVPVITCPAGITVSCEADVPVCPIDFAAFDALPGASATDNCDPTLAYSCTTGPLVGGACGGTIVRTFTVSDDCGNSSTCSQIITVDDNTVPVITCPAGLTVSCEADVPACPVDFAAFDALPGASASDNCDLSLTYSCTTGPLVGGGCGGTITRTHTVTDDCGNTATCTQVFTVDDNTVPVITCPVSVTVSCEADVPACPVDFAAFDALPGASATDNCDLALTYSCTTGPLVGGPCGGTITRTHTVTDDCGNTASCTQVFIVDDNTVPMITCPADVTVSCIADVPACPIDFAAFDVLPGASATDNCDLALTYNCTTGTLTGGACGGTIIRTHTVTDDCGNSASCTQVITVDDNTAPVITCPASVTVSCLSDVPACPVDFAAFDALPGASATDNCDPTLAYSCTTGPLVGGACGGTIVRTFTVSDDCGNSSTCSQIITVDDNTPPVLFGIPANVTVQCDAVPPPAMPTATDNCDPMVIVLPASSITPGSCPDSYIINRSWSATDACGNSSTASQTILVIDTQAPVFSGIPANVTVQCNAVPPPAMPTATDNCDAMVTTGLMETTIPGACPDSYTLIRTWTATDNCANSTTASQTIVVIDTQAPVLSGIPANVTVQCNAVPPPAMPTATDNCDAMVTITFLETSTPGACPDNYTLTRTWTATDNCNNSSSASQTLVVVDTQAPMFSGIPANVTVQCNAVPPPAMPTATDNCDAMVTITFLETSTPGACPDNYTITRTWTATDNCNNSTAASQILVVVDTQAPVFSGIPANVTVQCNAVPPPAMPTATDNCDAMVTIGFSESTIPGVCPDSYTLIRTWTGTDNCSNSATATQSVFVVDTQAPVFAGVPANVTVQCNAVPPPAMPTATDNCDAMATISFSESTIPGVCPDSYMLVRTWTATDNCANSTTATQSVFVVDTQAPVFAGIPANVTVQCDAVPPPAMPTATDNCDAMVTIGLSETTIPGACPDSYTLIRTWTATDNCANSTTASQTIVVIDTQAPVFSGIPANVTVQCDAVPPPATPTATDNCDAMVTITFMETNTPGSCPNNYILTRTWTATDNCNNSTIATQTVTVVDTQAPMITCPANVTVQCSSQVPASNIATASATDNCAGTVTITVLPDAISNMTCANRFTITRVYVATDVCGNTATCAQIITVFDDIPPMLTCPAGVTVQCASQVPPVNIASVTATDNCSSTATITHVGDVITNMTCVNRLTVTRTYRATDVCGNSATCSQIITVFDNTPPALTCPAGVTVQCAALVPAVNTAAVTSTDNCGGAATITHAGDVITNMTCANRFTLTRTYRATDACGNSATCTQVITVFDNTPPTITCPANVTVQCAAQVPPVNTASVIAGDNCAGAVTVIHVSDVITNQTCINRFTLTRTYRATDVCGNSATCTQVITVFDNTPPVITFIDPLLVGVPNGGTVEVQCFGQDPEWELPTFNNGSVNATDNCAGPVTVVFTDILVDEGDCEVDGYINKYRLTWTATDACGNSSSAFVFLELVDHIPPVIHNIPEDITVSCDEIPAPPLDIFATDECLCACVILFEESDPAPGCQNGQVITRTWTAEDDCGNMTVEVQNITLVDEEGPEIIMEHPALAGIESGTVLQYTCNEGGIPDFFDELNGESVSSAVSCGTSGDITFNDRTIIANNCKFWGYIEDRTYLWKGVDQCGNVSTFTITVQLIDTEPPVIVGVPDTACIDDPALKNIEVVDNCDNASLVFWDTPIDNPCGDGEAFRRTYEAYDNCGNVVRDTAILIPNDLTPPQILFMNPDLANLPSGEILEVECYGENGQYTPYGYLDAMVVDACMAGVTMTYSEQLMESGDCSDGHFAVVQLQWLATDACGNTGEASIIAHMIDNTPPQFINFQTEITIECGDELPEVLASDNCGEVTITTDDVIIPGACAFEYDVMRTHTAIDPCGNRTIRRQMIHVEGNGPVIEGVIEEVCDDLSIPEVTAFDPCAGSFVEVGMSQDTLDVPCRDGMVIQRTWTATDACGNVTEIVQHIVLNDKTPPEILVPTHSIIRKFDGQLYNLVMLSQTGIMEQLNALDAASVFVLDDCDQEINAVFTLDVTYSDNCDEDGYFERRVYTWTATDVCGNSESITFSVDIMDDIPPVLEGVPADETIICGQLPPPANVTATDPANPVELLFEEGIYYGDGPTEFFVKRSWTATDACGNVSQATQTIIWIPDTFIDCNIALPESVECNSHGVLIGSEVFGGLPGFTYLWEIEGEKCFIQSGQSTPEIIIYVGWSEVEISLTVTDAFGCSSVCTTTLDCVDPLDATVIANPHVMSPDQPVPHAGNSTNDLNVDVLQQFNLWPNPANASVNLSFESSIEHDVQFTLTNYLGQVVVSDYFEAMEGFNSRKIDVSQLANGSYLMQLVSETETRTKMLVIFGK